MKTGIFFATWLCAFALSAQTQPQPTAKALPPLKHELGINLFALTAQVPYAFSSLAPNYAPGLYYRRFWGKNVCRLSLDYFKKAQSDYNVWGRNYNISSTVRQVFELRAGYERHFRRGRMQPFAYGDAVFKYTEVNGTNFIHQEEFDPIPGPDIHDNFPVHEKSYHAGLSFGFGLRYRLSKSVNLLYENSFFHTLQVSHAISFRQSWQHAESGMSALSRLGLSIAF